MNNTFFSVRTLLFATVIFLAYIFITIPVHAASYQVVSRVSVDSLGNEGNGSSEFEGGTADISSDGRYVTFSSSATNLVAGDTNGFQDIFLHDTQTGTTTRVSVDSLGAEANDGSRDLSMSDDGRYVTFSSSATNLVAGDTNGVWDIFLHDTQTGTTTRVSVDSLGAEANDESFDPIMSNDGRYVAFESSATNLVAGDTNGFQDIFLHDTQTGTTTRVSVDSLGAEANDDNGGIRISSDGRYIAFGSIASNLVAGDTNGAYDIFLHDTQTGTTTRVSVDSLGAEGDADSTGVGFVSDDGRYVLFQSHATNLVAGDTNSLADVFLHDTQTGTTTRISTDGSNGEMGNAMLGAAFPLADDDINYVLFTSDSTDFYTDTNSAFDVFLKNTQTGAISVISRGLLGADSDAPVGFPTGSLGVATTPDMQYIVLTSNATNLVAGDTNDEFDTFIARLLEPEIVYTESFVENIANDGSLDGSRVATISDDTFTNPGGTLDEGLGQDYVLTNMPAGLTPVMTVAGDGLTATLTFTGNATSHESVNSVTDLTITFLDDAFVFSDASDVTGYEDALGVITFDDAPEESRRRSSSTSQSRAQAKQVFEAYYAEQDTGSNETPSNNNRGDSEGSTLGAGLCPANLIVTQNMKREAIDGQFHSYTQGTVQEVALLQAHINRILANYWEQAAGPVDGIFGPLTQEGVRRLQRTLRDEQGADLGPGQDDGIVGPMTRDAINNSCSDITE